MITSVLTILVAEAMFFGSRILALWAAGFFAVNHLHFLFVEEPGLVKRFGDTYVEYTREVPRWIPHFSRRRV